MSERDDQTASSLSLPEFLARRAQDARLARLTHDVVLPVARGILFGPAPEALLLPDSFVVERVDGPSMRSREMLGGADFAIADRVANTVPDLLGWLGCVYERLRVGGVLNLALPDRRFMADVSRPASTLGEILEAYVAERTMPSFRQIFEHCLTAAVDPKRLWAGSVGARGTPQYDDLASAYAQARAGLEDASCRCWVFTPLSFLDLLEGASRLGLTSFVMSEFASTEPNGTIFYVCLRRDAEQDHGRLRDLQLGAIGHLRGLLERRLRIARQMGSDTSAGA